jgi:hypothetical protein
MSDIAGSSSEGTVDQLLHDAGFDGDAALRSALQDLRGLAAGEQPEASAAVAALMVPAPTRHLAAVPAPATEPAPGTEPAPATEAAPAADELAARRRAKRRITLTTLSVAVSLAAGGAVAVASDHGFRDSIGHANQAVTSFVATMAGGNEAAPPAPLPARPVTPSTVPAAPATPSTPAVTQPVPVAPHANSGHTPPPSPGQPSPAKDAPLPGLPVPQNLTPGLPKVPDRLPVGEGQPPALPLPPTPPVHVPGVQP